MGYHNKRKLAVGVIIINIISLVALTAMIYLGILAAREIEENGLKAIVERVWEGPEEPAE